MLKFLQDHLQLVRLCLLFHQVDQLFTFDGFANGLEHGCHRLDLIGYQGLLGGQ